MTVWLDAHISPRLAGWITSELDCTCEAFRSLGHASTADRDVYLAARTAGAVIVSKDRDFVEWQKLLGPPPKVIWLRCGNRTNEQMKSLFSSLLPNCFVLLQTTDLVEIWDERP
jgi:predicted nuclease of predicted toxin-antitoxin system